MTPAPAGGYSGTPLARKLGIKPGHRVRLIARPDGWAVPDLPEDTEVTDGTAVTDGAPGDVTDNTEVTDGAPADVTVAFFRASGDLAAAAPTLAGDLEGAAMLWIAWPRKAAGHVSDITENLLREILLPLGVVDVKVAALGEDWSGLKFVLRKENRQV